jgi:hypothetical protein
MGAMRDFSNWVEAVGPSAAVAARPGSAVVSNGAAPVKAQSASRQKALANRLAALLGPYKEAISRNGPAAAQMQSNMDAAKKHIVQRDFEQAAKDLDKLEPLVEQSKIQNRNGPITDDATRADAASGDSKFVVADTAVAANATEVPAPILQTNTVDAEPSGGITSEMSADPSIPGAGKDRAPLESGDKPEPPNGSSVFDELSSSQRSADPAHPIIVPVDPNHPRVDKRVKLPKVDDVVGVGWVELTDASGETYPIKRSDVVKHKEYVDNPKRIQKLRVEIIDQWNLKVGPMQIFYSGGGPISVPYPVSEGGTVTDRYIYKDGFIYPVDQSDEPLFDRGNTPNILFCSRWVKMRLTEISGQRVKIAELTNSFARIMQAATSAAGGMQHISGGGGGNTLPRTGGTRRGTGGGGSVKPTGGTGGKPTGGTGGKPASGGDETASMRLPEPSGGKTTSGSGGSSGKNTRSGGTGGGSGGAQKPSSGGGSGKPPGKAGGSGGSGEPPPPNVQRTSQQIHREIAAERVVLNDLTRQGEGVLNAEGIVITKKNHGPPPAPKGEPQPAARRPSTKSVVFHLKRVADDDGSPRQAEARELLKKIEEAEGRISKLNGQLDPTQRDRI